MTDKDVQAESVGSISSFIPASQRPDGTWRKPRRVKDGYVPQDEVPLYESKGKQWANRKPGYPPGLDPELIKAKEMQAATQEAKKKKKKSTTPAGPQSGTSALSATPSPSQPVLIEKKVKEKKQESKTSGNMPSAKTDRQTSGQTTGKKVANNPTTPTECSEAIDPAKKLRNLKKKIKEIDTLEEKIKSKELKNPDKDQLSKISRRAEIEAAILSLEMDISLTLSKK